VAAGLAASPITGCPIQNAHSLPFLPWPAASRWRSSISTGRLPCWRTIGPLHVGRGTILGAKQAAAAAAQAEPTKSAGRTSRQTDRRTDGQATRTMKPGPQFHVSSRPPHLAARQLPPTFVCRPAEVTRQPGASHRWIRLVGIEICMLVQFAMLRARLQEARRLGLELASLLRSNGAQRLPAELENFSASEN